MKKFKGFLRGLGMLLVVVVGVAAWLALPWFVLLALAVLFAAWMAAAAARPARSPRSGSARCASASAPRRWW